jgi:hypothetical protein
VGALAVLDQARQANRLFVRVDRRKEGEATKVSTIASGAGVGRPGVLAVETESLTMRFTVIFLMDTIQRPQTAVSRTGTGLPEEE